MNQVIIYTYQSIKGPKSRNGAYTYILETETANKLKATLTSTELFEEPMSENKAELVTLLKALKRLIAECDLVIIAESEYIKQGIENWCDNWKANNWLNAKGKEIANAEEWKEVSDYLDKRKVIVLTNQQHEYKHWLETQTNKKLKEISDE